jgi:hypothetical protein
MAYVPACGDCLLIPFDNVPHLFVVMNDPCKDKLCLLLMVSSIKKDRHHDTACLLNAGDHPFINKPSFVVYRLAQTTPAGHIGNMVAKKYYTQKGVLDEKVFDRIVMGLEASENTRPAMFEYAESVGLVEPA